MHQAFLGRHPVRFLQDNPLHNAFQSSSKTIGAAIPSGSTRQSLRTMGLHFFPARLPFQTPFRPHKYHLSLPSTSRCFSNLDMVRIASNRSPRFFRVSHNSEISSTGHALARLHLGPYPLARRSMRWFNAGRDDFRNVIQIPDSVPYVHLSRSGAMTYFRGDNVIVDYYRLCWFLNVIL
jgi:hypothetical protein